MDDILVGHPDKDKSWEQWYESERILCDFPMPTKDAKGRPPNQRQVWLGKLYDTIKQWVKMDQAKFDKYMKYIRTVLGLKKIPVRMLVSIVGKVRYMGTIYRPLLAYARGMEAYYANIFCTNGVFDKSKSRMIDYDAIIHSTPNLRRMALFGYFVRMIVVGLQNF